MPSSRTAKATKAAKVAKVGIAKIPKIPKIAAGAKAQADATDAAEIADITGEAEADVDAARARLQWRIAQRIEEQRARFKRTLNVIRVAQFIEACKGPSAWEILAAHESKERWAKKMITEMRDALCRQQFGA